MARINAMDQSHSLPLIEKTGGGTIFQADRLTVTFAGAETHSPIQNFDLKINAQEITCILGKSGCGKTTLLKCLGGFILGEPCGGLLYKGRFTTGPSSDIVMIFQENNLYPWLTVKGNIRFGLKFRQGVHNKDALVAKMLETVGLTEAARRYPHQLSGGMRQRTAIARALVSNPEVLLLDEPFSALDISLRRRMQDLVSNLWQQTGKTMVMVTHNVGEAIRVGHRVIVLGGNPAEVLIDARTKDPAYRDRYSDHFLSLQKNIEDMIY